MVFVVERRTTRFLPTKVYHIVPGRGLVYCDHEKIFPKLAKNSLLTKTLLPEKYPLYGMYKPMYSLVIWQCAYTCIYQQVLVMNSLRKPKRLTIRGDDEKEWMFLVKAGEDLRLDQRIEQVHVHMYEYTYIFCSALR